MSDFIRDSVLQAQDEARAAGITGSALGRIATEAASKAVFAWQSSPITVWQNGSNVNIAAHVQFTGSTNTRIDGATPRQWVIGGITEWWDGHRDGYDVNVNIIERGNTSVSYVPGQAFLTIEIVNGFGTCRVDGIGKGPDWSRTNPGTIILHIGERLSSGITRTFSLDEARWIAAHEFGHAMGIGEGFNEITSVMNSSRPNWGNPVTSLDVRLAVMAHQTNRWQAWTINGNRHPLVEEHIRIHGIR